MKDRPLFLHTFLLTEFNMKKDSVGLRLRPLLKKSDITGLRALILVLLAYLSNTIFKEFQFLNNWAARTPIHYFCSSNLWMWLVKFDFLTDWFFVVIPGLSQTFVSPCFSFNLTGDDDIKRAWTSFWY